MFKRKKYNSESFIQCSKEANKSMFNISHFIYRQHKFIDYKYCNTIYVEAQYDDLLLYYINNEVYCSNEAYVITEACSTIEHIRVLSPITVMRHNAVQFQ